LALLGRPSDPDLSQALNLGLCALLPAAPAPEEVFVALHQAFELMDVKARSESRGKWLNRYRYELGELIENRARADDRTRNRQTAQFDPGKGPPHHGRGRRQHVRSRRRRTPC